MLGAGLAYALLGATLGFHFACIAIGLAIFGFVTRHPRRAFAASTTALALAVLAIVLSVPVWQVLFSGRATDAEPLDYGEASPFVFLAALQAIAVLASSVTAAREGLRRLS